MRFGSSHRAQRIDAVAPRVLDHPTACTHLRIVGESVEWRRVLREATQVAATDTTVLLFGWKRIEPPPRRNSLNAL